MSKKLKYINDGRGGYIVYQDEKSTIKFSFEFGGGNCVVIIFVPTPDEWIKQTNRSLSERNEILTFIAEQSIQDQSPNSTYNLTDKWIEILHK